MGGNYRNVFWVELMREEITVQLSVALGDVPARLARNAFMLEAGEQLDETETHRISTAAYPNVQNV